MKLRTIIKTILLIFLVVAVYLGARTILGDQDFVVAIGKGLEQFLDQEQTLDDDQEQEVNDSEVADVPSRIKIHKGLPAVKLSDDILSQSGIQIASLQVATYSDEAQVTGIVVDFKPLLMRRSEYQQAGSVLAQAKESFRASSKIYERLRALYKERANISQRQVEEARFRMTEDKARLVAASQHLQNIQTATRQEWGRELTDEALGSSKTGSEHDKEESRYFERLLERQDVLVLITLPANVALPDKTSFIALNTNTEREGSRKAYLISPASHTDPLTQGETYYFKTSSKNLRIGMRLTAWISLSDTVDTGVNIPFNAIIWYSGQPWVYVKVDDDLYQRRPVSNYRETDSGWFITDTFKRDEKIVIKGGQLLLSEELRWQIPDEDDD